MDGVDQVLPPLADEGKALPLVNGSTPWPGVLEQGITRGGEETGMNWTTLHVDDPTGSKCTMGSTASGEAGCQPSFDEPTRKRASTVSAAGKAAGATVVTVDLRKWNGQPE